MIINATPHAVNVFKQDQVTSNPAVRKLILNEGEKPFQSIPPSGKLLNAQCSKDLVGDYFDIPLYKVEFTSVDEPKEVFPQYFDFDSEDYIYIIVSQMYVAGYKATMPPDSLIILLTVGDVIYDNSANPRPCGCLGLVVN